VLVKGRLAEKCSLNEVAPQGGERPPAEGGAMLPIGPPQKQGLALTWAIDGIPGVECLRARSLRHHCGRHCHDTYAIGVIEAGVGGNRCRCADHYTPAGSIVVMNPGEAHTGCAAGDLPLSYRYLTQIRVERAKERLAGGTPAESGGERRRCPFSAMAGDRPGWGRPILPRTPSPSPAPRR
jgi:hypothetical protein